MATVTGDSEMSWGGKNHQPETVTSFIDEKRDLANGRIRG